MLRHAGNAGTGTHARQTLICCQPDQLTSHAAERDLPVRPESGAAALTDFLQLGHPTLHFVLEGYNLRAEFNQYRPIELHTRAH